MPIAAVKLFGFTAEQWSRLVASMGLIGAVIALAFGPLIDRWGARRMLLLTAGLVCFHALLLAATESLWVNRGYAEHASYPQSYLVMALILIALIGAIAVFRHEGGEGRGYGSSSGGGGGPSPRHFSQPWPRS